MRDFTGWSQFDVKTTDHAGSVTLYQAKIRGTDCFKAQGDVSGASSDTFLSVATDIVGAKTWSSAGVTEAKVLLSSGTTLDYYQYLHVPVVSDRFWFLHGTLIKETGRVGLRWEKTWSDGGPYASDWQAVTTAHPSAVEPPVNVGAWLFDTSGTAVRVTYLICTDAGGSIPAWAQSQATRGTLPNTVDDLVKEGQRRAK